MFEPVLEQGLEYQISVVENTVKTDAKGREGGVLIVTSGNDTKLGYGRLPLFIP